VNYNNVEITQPLIASEYYEAIHNLARRLLPSQRGFHCNDRCSHEHISQWRINCGFI